MVKFTKEEKEFLKNLKINIDDFKDLTSKEVDEAGCKIIDFPCSYEGIDKIKIIPIEVI